MFSIVKICAGTKGGKPEPMKLSYFIKVKFQLQNELVLIWIRCRFFFLSTYLVQHIDEEARLARQKALTALQCVLEAGLQNVGRVSLLEAGTQCQESVVDEQQLVAHTAGEVGQQPARVARITLLANASRVTLKSTRAIGNDGRTWGTRWPVHTVAGLRQTNMRRIALDHIDIDTPRDWTHTVRDKAGVLRRFLNVVDLQYAAIWVKVLPHCRRRV